MTESTELVVAEPTGLVDVQTGEVLPATITNAAKVLESARDLKKRIDRIVAETTEYLVEETTRQGTKTLRAGDTTLVLSGGLTEDYDPQALVEALIAADCPAQRIEEAVVPTVTYKVNRSVLRQLAAANEDYKAAIELATFQIEKPYRAAVK